MSGLVAHVALAPHLGLGKAAPDVPLVVVAAVAAGRGPRTGAAFGFAAGLGADIFLATPLGTSALAYTLVGHIIGRSSQPRRPGAAAALCSPASPCFACRRGRRPARLHRRSAARRSAIRRGAVLAAAAVGGGRLATAAVATALGGAPFPRAPGLFRIAAMAAVSAPLGPVVVAVVRRLPPSRSGGGLR